VSPYELTGALGWLIGGAFGIILFAGLLFCRRR